MLYCMLKPAAVVYRRLLCMVPLVQLLLVLGVGTSAIAAKHHITAWVLAPTSSSHVSLVGSSAMHQLLWCSG